MHLIVLTQTHPSHWDKIVKHFSKKRYKTQGFEGSPTIREIKLFEICVRKELMPLVIKDIRAFEEFEGNNKKQAFKALYDKTKYIRKFFSPLKEVDRSKNEINRDMIQIANNESWWMKTCILGYMDDEYRNGLEVV